MKKDLVYIRGWASIDYSYKDFEKSIPKNFKVHVISPEDLIPNLDLSKARKNFKAFIKKNNLNKFILVGHSLGGALSIYLAANFEKNIEKLVLINSAGVKTEVKLIIAAKNLLLQTIKKRNKTLAYKIIESLNLIKRPLFQTKLAQLAHTIDLEKYASKVNVPTQILWGEDDVLIPPKNGKKLQKLIKGSKIKILPNLDHDWILYAPNKLWKELA